MAFMFPAGQFTLKQGNPDATVIFCTDDEYFEKLLGFDMADRLSIVFLEVRGLWTNFSLHLKTVNFSSLKWVANSSSRKILREITRMSPVTPMPEVRRAKFLVVFFCL